MLGRKQKTVTDSDAKPESPVVEDSMAIEAMLSDPMLSADTEDTEVAAGEQIVSDETECLESKTDNPAPIAGEMTEWGKTKFDSITTEAGRIREKIHLDIDQAVAKAKAEFGMVTNNSKASEE